MGEGGGSKVSAFTVDEWQIVKSLLSCSFILLHTERITVEAVKGVQLLTVAELKLCSTGDSLFAGAVVGAAAERHTDHTAGEGHKQGMVIPVQLKTQHPPVLSLHVASRNTEKHQLSWSDIFDFVSF